MRVYVVHYVPVLVFSKHQLPLPQKTITEVRKNSRLCEHSVLVIWLACVSRMLTVLLLVQRHAEHIRGILLAYVPNAM